ncbi:hypothetical protein [Nocardia sp. alder85J]|uniref:hypothetical protein n=1 Tax=Nocardia sp. alder85J TaxID=2862949 RepID=UPI001CD39693|nr:hypothetical protein [Nocardia sp. alder85J]MCX4094792.1 hypothetical protein [Nocardia sp. alder85J]
MAVLGGLPRRSPAVSVRQVRAVGVVTRCRRLRPPHAVLSCRDRSGLGPHMVYPFRPVSARDETSDDARM